ncbi:antibiotic biosynthesis monooxygenase family protein [Streptomyces sp. NPDC049555]|uniref:antibiotic biosynthesis monooxygenase family protein n=1 Tax=unclassified Streptomyces TaxID=2593676 RepID=UPI00342F0EEA
MPLPGPGAEGAGVTFVNRFTLHDAAGGAEEFEKVFAETAEFLCRQPGFRHHTLLVPAGPPDGGGPHYVNVAVWDDEAAFRAALARPGFGAHAAALRALSSSEPALYRPRQVRVAPTAQGGAR